MNVLILHNQQAGLPSGERMVAEEDAEHLRAAGIDARLHIVENPPPEAMSLLHKARTAAELMWSVPSGRAIGRLIDEYVPDVVHLHSILPQLSPSAFAACRSRGVPVVQTLHNFRWLCVEGGLYRDGAYCDACVGRNPWPGLRHRCARGSLPLSAVLTGSNLLHVRSRWLFRNVDAFIAVSRFVRDTYVRGGFPPEKLVVRYNTLKRPEAVTPGPKREGVVFVGRLTEAKGMRHLRHMMRALPEVPFTIVGAGPEEAGLRGFVREHSLERVKFLGALDRRGVYQQLAAAECAVMPSQVGETFGRVALEAMAMRTPLVASNIGGLGELIADNAGAVPVDPADSEGFVEAVKGIVGSPERVEAMGQAGYATAERQWFNKDPAADLVEIYASVMGRNPGRG